MPTLLHETLVMLFQKRPRLAPELIREALEQPLPVFDEVTLQDANLSQIVPTEFRADLVVLLRSGHPVYGIVVEIQLRRDADKEYSWPVYVTALRARYRCPCRLLVVTPDRAVARWAARPIELAPPGDIVTPLVIGPDAIPVITDPILGQVGKSHHDPFYPSLTWASMMRYLIISVVGSGLDGVGAACDSGLSGGEAASVPFYLT